MLFRQLEYFVALAREQHFAKAAQACYVSQPSLSEAIRKLEHELGVPLVNRGRSFEGLTPEGERLVAWARRILADQEALKLEVAAMRTGLQGRLRLGVVPTASTTAALLLGPFCAEHPLVGVALETRLPTAEILTRLDRFELDAGIVHPEEGSIEEQTATHLYHERTVLAASRELVPDSVTELTWAELAELPLCALNESMRRRQAIDKALALRGLTLRPEVMTDSIASVYALAATGRWAGVASDTWFHAFPRSTEVRLIPLVDPVVTFPVALVTGHSEPGSVLAEALAAYAATLALDEFFDGIRAAGQVGRITQRSAAKRTHPA